MLWTQYCYCYWTISPITPCLNDLKIFGPEQPKGNRLSDRGTCVCLATFNTEQLRTVANPPDGDHIWNLCFLNSAGLLTVIYFNSRMCPFGAYWLGLFECSRYMWALDFLPWWLTAGGQRWVIPASQELSLEPTWMVITCSCNCCGKGKSSWGFTSNHLFINP